MSTTPDNVTVNAEFLKLARSMREAQREAKKPGHVQRDERRAQNLEQLFDAKLAAIEKEHECIQELRKSAQFPERLL